MALVLDTGPIVAFLDEADPEHDRCVAMAEAFDETLVVPVPVLVEVDYWLCKLYGPEAWAEFVLDLVRGAYRLHHPDEADLVRAADLEQTYADLDLGFVDAIVIATCERLGEIKVATLDRRDFSVVRPLHCERLRILPE